MNLIDFINSNSRNEWIDEPGITYYVRKSIFIPGIIELANVVAIGEVKDTQFGFVRFIKRYERNIPFIAEQVINPAVAKFFRQKKWHEKITSYSDIAAQFVSPLAIEEYKDNDRFVRKYM